MYVKKVIKKRTLLRKNPGVTPHRQNHELCVDVRKKCELLLYNLQDLKTYQLQLVWAYTG